jgi:predicted nucleic acid-binding protein
MLAKQLGHIPSIKAEIDKLEGINFRISESIIKHAIEICGE